MKRTALMVFAIAFIFSAATIGPARAETQQSSKQCPMGEMMGKEIKGKGGSGCPEGMMFRHCLMNKQMIATPDGGVVVSIGKKLYKYDSSLNLIKEAEIPIDLEGMKKAMMNMNEKEMTQEKTEKHEESLPAGTGQTKTK